MLLVCGSVRVVSLDAWVFVCHHVTAYAHKLIRGGNKLLTLVVVDFLLNEIDLLGF